MGPSAGPTPDLFKRLLQRRSPPQGGGLCDLIRHFRRALVIDDVDIGFANSCPVGINDFERVTARR
jgi:hypothetical protein